MKQLIFLCVALYSTSSVACFAPPPEQFVTAPELLAKSSDVSLAKVVKAEMTESGEVQYYFEVERRFAGPDRTAFQVLGHPAIWGGDNQTFSNHFDASFWKRQGGRESSDTDCEIHPTFAVGGTYLIFLGQPYTRKSFELVIHTHGDAATRDKWLQYVERHFERSD